MIRLSPPRKLISIFLLSLILATGCAELNNPGGGYYGSRDPYYDNSRRDGYYNDDYDRERHQARRERERLEDERERAQSERERLEQERRAIEAERARAAAERQRQENHRREERCPSGFSPSERKCSDKERRNGCRDMRLPGGLGCVSR
jgi:hypothetical protein